MIIKKIAEPKQAGTETTLKRETKVSKKFIFIILTALVTVTLIAGVTGNLMTGSIPIQVATVSNPGGGG